MAKTHESRALTPEETARRKAVIEQAKEGASASMAAGYAARLEMAAQAIGPAAIDYDRDGYPDQIVGRSGRNFSERARQANTEAAQSGQTTLEAPVQRDYSKQRSLGIDGFAQNQMGYRDRLRARMAAAVELADDESDEAQLQARGRLGVSSHGSTGVGGGMPASSVSRPSDAPVPEGARPGYTPLDQAMMAPQTPRTGFVNKGAARAGVGIAAPLPRPANVDGSPEMVRRGSFGTVPVQGTMQPDGSFAVGGAEPDEEAPAKTHGKQHEPAKGHEHTEHKPAEHGKAHEHVEHKPAEHKPAEHKPPEHHGKR